MLLRVKLKFVRGVMLPRSAFLTRFIGDFRPGNPVDETG